MAGAGAAPQIGGFLSTLSLRRATCCPATAPRANSYFYPRSPCGERRASCRICYAVRKFLSTLSLRRATFEPGPGLHRERHFYPRSPCGERLSSPIYLGRITWAISIHALLAESDQAAGLRHHRNGISIHALLAESDKFEGINFWQSIISIHALLAESDQRAQGVDC